MRPLLACFLAVTRGYIAPRPTSRPVPRPATAKPCSRSTSPFGLVVDGVFLADCLPLLSPFSAFDSRRSSPVAKKEPNTGSFGTLKSILLSARKRRNSCGF